MPVHSCVKENVQRKVAFYLSQPSFAAEKRVKLLLQHLNPIGVTFWYLPASVPTLRVLWCVAPDRASQATTSGFKGWWGPGMVSEDGGRRGKALQTGWTGGSTSYCVQGSNACRTSAVPIFCPFSSSIFFPSISRNRCL